MAKDAGSSHPKFRWKALRRTSRSPPPADDLDIENLSLDLSAASIDADIGDAIDDSGIERVPMADGIEVRTLA